MVFILFNADENLKNADWIKEARDRWILPKYKSEEFMKMLEDEGMTLSEFRELPVYKSAIEKGLIEEYGHILSYTDDIISIEH